MATLIPSLNSCLGRMTSGEKRFARRLEAFLEGDYLCWYDVTVGIKRRRPDFLILNPHRGLLALEVKDWKVGSIIRLDPQLVEAEFDGRLVKDVNPLLKSREFMTATVDMLKRDPLLVEPATSKYAGKLCMPYGHGLVLPNISRQEFETSGMQDVMPGRLVICKDEMTESADPEAFQQRLWDMFTQPFRCLLQLPQIDRIRWHLFPDVRIVSRQGSLFEADDEPATQGARPRHPRPHPRHGPAAGAARPQPGRWAPRDPRRGRLRQNDDPRLPRRISCASFSQARACAVLQPCARAKADRVDGTQGVVAKGARAHLSQLVRGDGHHLSARQAVRSAR
uniref:NERD domain-containing protein n=1 Tax=Ralstonia solanacearum TaxID=305 RepID=A0A0S4WL10_RALSL|nr:protein of unknown function [Ralstonia solanacearum]